YGRWFHKSFSLRATRVKAANPQADGNARWSCVFPSAIRPTRSPEGFPAESPRNGACCREVHMKNWFLRRRHLFDVAGAADQAPAVAGVRAADADQHATARSVAVHLMDVMA